MFARCLNCEYSIRIFPQGLIFVLPCVIPTLCLELLWGIWVEHDENCISCKTDATTFSGFSGKTESAEMAGKVFCQGSPSRCRVWGCSVGHRYPPICHHSNFLYSIFFSIDTLTSLKNPDEFIWHTSATCRIKHWVGFFSFLYPAAVRGKRLF